VLALPRGPSIAVLPLANLSGNPNEAYFSDGLTEDIITALTRFSDLFVIARYSTSQFRGESVDPREAGRYDTFAAKEHARARDCLERTVELAPDYSRAWSRLGFMYIEEHKYGYNTRPRPFERALAAVQKALELDPKNQDGYYALAIIRYMREKDFDAFHATAEQALALNPNDAWIVGDLGTWTAYSGEFERGKALVRKSMVLNPLHQRWLHFPFFLDHYRKGEYREALTVALKINLPDNHMAQAGLAAVYGQLGETEKARAVLADILARHPKFADDPRAAFVTRRMPRDLVEALMDGLRKAGLQVPPAGA
jgi:adenylate cyclase